MPVSCLKFEARLRPSLMMRASGLQVVLSSCVAHPALHAFCVLGLGVLFHPSLHHHQQGHPRLLIIKKAIPAFSSSHGLHSYTVGLGDFPSWLAFSAVHGLHAYTVGLGDFPSWLAFPCSAPNPSSTQCKTPLPFPRMQQHIANVCMYVTWPSHGRA